MSKLALLNSMAEICYAIAKSIEDRQMPSFNVADDLELIRRLLGKTHVIAYIGKVRPKNTELSRSGFHLPIAASKNLNYRLFFVVRFTSNPSTGKCGLLISNPHLESCKGHEIPVSGRFKNLAAKQLIDVLRRSFPSVLSGHQIIFTDFAVRENLKRYKKVMNE